MITMMMRHSTASTPYTYIVN